MILYEKNVKICLKKILKCCCIFISIFRTIFNYFLRKKSRFFKIENGLRAGSPYLTLSKNISGNGSPSGIRSWVKTEISKFNFNKERFNYRGVNEGRFN